MKANNKGFTLMEMIIVMIILGLLLSTSLVYLNSKSATRKLDDQATIFVNRLELVRNYATTGQACTECDAVIADNPSLDLELHGYGLYVDLSTTHAFHYLYADLDNDYQYTPTGNDVILEEYEMDEQIVINSCVDSTVFDPSVCDVLFTLYEGKIYHIGNEGEDEVFNLLNEEGNDRDISVSGLTGKIDIL